MSSRGLCLGAITNTEQQGIDADIFVQILPMQSAAASADDGSLTLFVIRFQKPREVCERDRKLATVSQKHSQIVGVEPEFSCIGRAHFCSSERPRYSADLSSPSLRIERYRS